MGPPEPYLGGVGGEGEREGGKQTRPPREDGGRVGVVEERVDRENDTASYRRCREEDAML